MYTYTYIHVYIYIYIGVRAKGVQNRKCSARGPRKLSEADFDEQTGPQQCTATTVTAARPILGQLAGWLAGWLAS